MKQPLNMFQKNIPFIFILWGLINVCYEFYQIAWGTGNWLGEFALSWGIAFFAILILSLVILAFTLLFSIYPDRFNKLEEYILRIRSQIGWGRWILCAFIFLFPIIMFQYSIWGVVFQKLYIRLFVWGITVIFITLLASSGNNLFDFRVFLIFFVLTASIFSILAFIGRVSDYPFSLGWSEGNRMWDFSILFGKDLYLYPPDRVIPVLIDRGRQIIGGLPFILPHLTITQERFWIGLTRVLPYLLLGLVAFYPFQKDKKNMTWLLAVLWTFLFLKQGPIHPPLTISAAFVILAWRSPNWLAIPFIILAGYITQASRFTWVFAPAIWIVILTFVSAPFSDFKSALPAIRRAILLAVFALFGSFILSNLISYTQKIEIVSEPSFTEVEVAPDLDTLPSTPTPPAAAQETPNSFIELIIYAITVQPLLWYRLLPNSTYEQGILLGLLLAVLPLTLILVYLIRQRIWSLNRIKIITFVLPLLAFLAVGLIASVKIGGGGDLHNMDMFLISMLFLSVLAWHSGAMDWLHSLNITTPAVIKLLLIVMIANSSINSMMQLRSYSYGEKVTWLKILTDMPSEASLEMLPTQAIVEQSLQTITQEVAIAQNEKEVLFIDQRQLLTFGYIVDVPLVAEYEKKILMNEALSDNAKYFSRFYSDLANKRFSLIVSEPLKTPIQNAENSFGEENNAWVKWVSIPVLCYYDITITLREVNVQLLVPKPEPVNCSDALPMELRSP